MSAPVPVDLPDLETAEALGLHDSDDDLNQEEVADPSDNQNHQNNQTLGES